MLRRYDHAIAIANFSTKFTFENLQQSSQSRNHARKVYAGIAIQKSSSRRADKDVTRMT